MSKSKIEWTNETDNVFVVADESDPTKQHGWWCQPVSPGCKNCYAERLNLSPFYHGNLRLYRLDQKPETFLFRRDILASWKRKTATRMHFVNSMTDTFGDWYPDEWVFELLDAMADAPKQIFQVLTKRSARMVDLSRKWLAIKGFARIPRNIWMMVSAEDQERADERVNDLIHVPAIVRGISAEPLLGAINFSFEGIAPKSATPSYIPVGNMIDWVIVGGESGPGARPMHPDWARSIRSQCQECEIPFLFKQWGEWIGGYHDLPGELESRVGCGDVSAIQTMDDGTPVYRFGKKAAGRLLDGQEWNGYPEIN